MGKVQNMEEKEERIWIRIKYQYSRYSMNPKNKEKQGSRNIEVAIRMRPLLHLFEDDEVWEINPHHNTITSLNDNMLTRALKNVTENTNNLSFTSVPSASKPKKKSGMSAVEKTHRYEFTYDYAFGPADCNTEVYVKCCQEIINEFCTKGRNGTIFMYGQTTSGKTYTMLGDEHTRGLISYSLGDICQQSFESESDLSISYLEIYNEQINDLLNPGSVNLKIADDQVLGAQLIAIDSFEQAMELLQMGEEQRSYSEKKYHDHSSRSHTIFQIRKQNGRHKSVLNLVDLAGSERLSEEETNEQTGYINKSLFVLSTVIQRLASGKKNTHVPFRDSKLTRILAPSISGQSLTTVICTVSPAAVNFYQTLSTLRFASCSRKVQLKPFTSSPDLNNSLNSTSSKELERLKQENQRLKKDIDSLSISQAPQENYLERKVQQITELLAKKNPHLRDGWQEKLQMLCLEYHKNIETLQKEYTKALVNAVSVECEVPKQSLNAVLQQCK